MSEQQLNAKSPDDVELRALRAHEKHFGNTKYNWRKIDQRAEELWESQQFDEAERLDRLAIELAEHHWGADNKDTLVLKGNLASTLWARGQYNEALQLEADVVNAGSFRRAGQRRDVMVQKQPEWHITCSRQAQGSENIVTRRCGKSNKSVWRARRLHIAFQSQFGQSVQRPPSMDRSEEDFSDGY